MVANDRPDINHLYSPSQYAGGDPEKVISDWLSAHQKIYNGLKTQYPSTELEYGTGDRQKIDVFGNVSDRLIVLIHGGYWQEGDRTCIIATAVPFLKNNHAVATVGYTLATGERPLSKTIDDVILAVKFLLEKYPNVKECDIIGHSAGAHLAFHVAKNIQNDRIKNIVLLAAIFDIKELVNCEIGRAIGLKLEESLKTECKAVDLSQSKQLGVLILIGQNESPKFIEQNVQMFRDLSALLSRVQYSIFEDTNHFDLTTKLADESAEETKVLHKFLGI